ncbi:GNAT family N-acetyltransferase [Heyndrickxia sp. MSNUG]|uniref:GNAT family N-acetyltransferase n=1 Tax=Heyndrickxia sp. MSNUG TaxID=3136677 RepID=UPI003C2EAA46
MEGDFQIRLAAKEDTNDVIAFLKKIAQWMENNKINQWQYLLSGGDDEEIKEAILHKETFILLKEDNVIGTFTVSSRQSEWDHHVFGFDFNSESLYLHRLAISPENMGKGLGKEIIDWIHKNVKTEKKYIKLDCVAHNRKLNQFYKDNGFEYIGEKDQHSKYQKPFTNQIT